MKADRVGGELGFAKRKRSICVTQVQQPPFQQADLIHYLCDAAWSRCSTFNVCCFAASLVTFGEPPAPVPRLIHPHILQYFFRYLSHQRLVPAVDVDVQVPDLKSMKDHFESKVRHGPSVAPGCKLCMHCQALLQHPAEVRPSTRSFWDVGVTIRIACTPAAPKDGV